MSSIATCFESFAGANVVCGSTVSSLTKIGLPCLSSVRYLSSSGESPDKLFVSVRSRLWHCIRKWEATHIFLEICFSNCTCFFPARLKNVGQNRLHNLGNFRQIEPRPHAVLQHHGSNLDVIVLRLSGAADSLRLKSGTWPPSMHNKVPISVRRRS